MTKPKYPEKTVAVLTMVVTYEEVPDKSEVEDLIEKACELGGVESAVLKILKTSTVKIR